MECNTKSEIERWNREVEGMPQVPSPEKASGAPALAGQGVGASGLALKREEEKEIDIVEIRPIGAMMVRVRTEPARGLEKEEEIRLWNELDDMCLPLITGVIALRYNANREKGAYLYTIYRRFIDAAFSRLSRKSRRSIERIVGVCREADEAKLVSYVPLFRELIHDLKRTSNKELEELAEKLSGMTFAELLAKAPRVLEVMDRNRFYDGIRKLAWLTDYTSRLSYVLFKETEKLTNGAALSL